MTETWSDPGLAAWADRADRMEFRGHEIAVFDVAAAEQEQYEPLLIIHGFPTSSYDWSDLVPRLSRRRRVVLLDLLGFGLSSKPDQPYTMARQADVVTAVLSDLGLDRIALMTHDMGDTVGGELLAREMEGSWPGVVTRRVVTNGSIYIGLAHLTDGQQLLLAMPDRKLPEGAGPELLAVSLAATLAPAHAHIDMTAHAQLVCHDGGDALLPRTIRYVEERRANERRFTGAIETHPSPLHVVWGLEDPIAVSDMAERLVTVRPDATLTWLPGIGHYPMIEDPEGFLDAVTPFLEAHGRAS